MANHPSRTLLAAARKIAKANGYSVSRHTWTPSRYGWIIERPGSHYLDERQTPLSTSSKAWIVAAALALAEHPDACFGASFTMRGAIERRAEEMR